MEPRGSEGVSHLLEGHTAIRWAELKAMVLIIILYWMQHDTIQKIMFCSIFQYQRFGLKS